MFNIVSAEYQKTKRTFAKKLAWLTPIITALLCGILGAGQLFQNGCYNWWYTMLLPGALTLICGSIIQKDKKKLNYRAILSLPINPSKIWLGKIAASVLMFLISCIVFFAAVTLGGFLLGNSITLDRSAIATVVLFVTFLWQIPLCLLLSDRLGLFAAIIINVGANIACVVCAAKTVFWWIPFSIPTRLMCPIVRVLPNGLCVPDNDPLLSTSVILPGVVIAVLLFVAVSALSVLPYRKLEAE